MAEFAHITSSRRALLAGATAAAAGLITTPAAAQTDAALFDLVAWYDDVTSRADRAFDTLTVAEKRFYAWRSASAPDRSASDEVYRRDVEPLAAFAEALDAERTPLIVEIAAARALTCAGLAAKARIAMRLRAPLGDPSEEAEMTDAVLRDAVSLGGFSS